MKGKWIWLAICATTLVLLAPAGRFSQAQGPEPAGLTGTGTFGATGDT